MNPEIAADALRCRAEALCRSVAPLDLAGIPLYIVPQSRLPDYLGGASVCGGFTAPSLDLYLRDVIGPAWRGRGPCMVIDDVLNESGNPGGAEGTPTDLGRNLPQNSAESPSRRNLPQDSGESPSERNPATADDLELDVCRIALHELAHILERPALYRDREDADPDRLTFEALATGQIVAEEIPADDPTPPFAGHEAGFIRVALHLRHRAETAGVLVPLYGYCAGGPYGLSHANRYRQALGDEPRRLAGAAIRDILRRPAPESFSCLWAEDMARWRRFCFSNVERTLSHVIGNPT